MKTAYAVLIGLLLTGCGGTAGLKGVFTGPTVNQEVDNLLALGNKEICKQPEGVRATIAAKLSIITGYKIDPTVMCK